MKVIIASTISPFVYGGGTQITEWLGHELSARGHDVELFNIPFRDHHDMLEQMTALRLLDLRGHADRLIAIRTPVHLLRHHSKNLWFIHHYRAAYDLWKTPFSGLPETLEGVALRDSIRASDDFAFAEARHIFSNSHVVAHRLKRFNNVAAEVLFPPIWRPERFHQGPFGDYVLYVSRITLHKRQALAIEALRYTETPVRVVIMGKPDTGGEFYGDHLHELVARYQLQDRATIVTRWVTEEEKSSILAGALAAAYFPFDEDSYGYPSLEAHHAGKPVVSTHDAGGTSELITDGVNGLLTDPTPQAVARAFDRLYRDRDQARSMGRAGLARIAELDISWDRVVRCLLS